jgi:methionyl-tRNA formyltransferase
MGTPEFAVKSLEILANSRHEVVGVVTGLDRPRGRGHKVSFPPVKEKALELGLYILQPEKINTIEFRDTLQVLRPDLIITACCSHYITRWIRDFPPCGCINLHPSLLPLYRGTSPVKEAILRGDKKTGITTFYLDKGWDMGDIILQREIDIDYNETGGSLDLKLSLLGSEILLDTVDLIEKGIAQRILQDHSKAVYTEKIFPEHGEIDWSCEAINIERKIRAYNPNPGTFTFYKETKFKIWEARVINDNINKAGLIIHANQENGLVIGTGKGNLEITILQMPSRAKLKTRDFLRGYKMEEGLILGKHDIYEQ